MFEIICQDSKGNTVTNLTQWDTDQSLIIQDTGLLVAPEFHFCNKNSKEALVVASSIEDGVISVKVPNVLLQEGTTIIAYLYSYDSMTSGKTLATIRIPVRPRPKPSDYTYVENIDYVSAMVVEQKMNQFIEDVNSGNIVVDVSSKVDHDANGEGGIQIGRDTTVQNDGIAIGLGARAEENGISLGYNSRVEDDGIAIGRETQSSDGSGIAIGNGAKAKDGAVAIGENAKATSPACIQLGVGENEHSFSLQVFEHQLMDDYGEIPIERMSKMKSYIDEVAANIAGTADIIKPSIFTATKSSVDDNPFATYDEKTDNTILTSSKLGDWSVGQPYTSFTFEIMNEQLNGIDIIFAEDDTQYYMINCNTNNSLQYFSMQQYVDKSTKNVSGLNYRNTFKERKFELGEKILFKFFESITITKGGNESTVNRFVIYRKREKDVCFRQFQVFDFPTTVTPILGFYSYALLSNVEIRGLYIDVNIPEYPVYNGYLLANNGKDDSKIKNRSKKWWALGDSLTDFNESTWQDNAVDDTDYGTENATYGVNYIHYVEAITGYKACKKVNGGSYGVNMHSLTDSNWSIYSRKDIDGWDSVTADLITLFAGTNDFYYGAEIGTIDDYINNTGISTIYGALRLYIDYFKTKDNENNTLQIVLITPPQRFSGEFTINDANSKGYYLIDYVNAIKTVGAYESIPVVDLYNNGGIGRYNYEYALKENEGLHPTKIGYNLIADAISKVLLYGSSATKCDGYSKSETEAVIENAIKQSIDDVWGTAL